MHSRLIRTCLAALAAALMVVTADVAQAQQLSINDVTQAETQAGTTTFVFTVSLDAPAGPSGVTFDIATADDSATSASGDYVFQSLTGQSIPSGMTTYTFNVTVNGGIGPEHDETFFVDVTNVTGATIADGQGLGTIVNDDVTPIHDVQGNGNVSPIFGVTVAIRGIVTGVASDGFFVQEEDADVDADPATSEGIFVFTSSAPPAAAAFSAQVEVIGTAFEFAPSSDPQDPLSTRIISPTVVQILAPGQTLPSAMPLTISPAFPDPAGPFDQLERVEHMRVTVASITVSGPSAGSVSESDATGTSNGRFHGVVTGTTRPFREAGVQAPDTVPSGTIPPIPRWDFNPERLRIDSAAINSQPVITVQSGDVVGPITGPLDYRSRGYAILPDGTSTIIVTPGTLPTTVSTPAVNEVTVASVNLRRLFDTVNDSGTSDTVLTPTAYDRRLAKASIAIRTHLRNPDVIGVQEAETLGVLTDLAARIVLDGGPSYDVYLVEGNDGAGLDVGVLVKTTTVTGGVPRVAVTSVTQELAGTTWIDPTDNQPRILHDRPPLVLVATVNRTSDASFPIVVVVADLLQPTGIADESPDGLTTTGDRVRKKRLAQAQDLANYLQSRQTTDPTEHLMVVGSFNAFELNDGYADVMNTIVGTPPPDNETVVPGDGVDLVNPNLSNLVNTPAAAERYSEVFEGNARNVDHALVSAALITDTSARRIEHPRIAADYPETHINNDTTALRFSDRDPVVAYFSTESLSVADLQITKVAAPDPILAGQQLTYTITITNNGPDAAASVLLSDTLPTDVTFVSLASPGGWGCAEPPVGATGTVACSIATMNVGSAVFTITVAVSPSLAPGTLSNTATVSSSTTDPTPTDQAATEDTTVDGPPTITAIADQTIAEDGATTALPFTIADPVTPVGSLTLAVGSSDQTLVPDANIVIGGSGGTRNVTVTPAANRNGGPVTITITVSDGTFSTNETFALAVTAVNDAPTISAIVNQTASANATVGPLAVTIDDIDDAPSSLTLSGTSSNQTLVANAGITFAGSGTARTVTIAPLPDQSGQTTITVTVSDGEASTSTSFVLTVTPLPPTARTYFLAEGATGAFFDEDLIIANPHATDAPVTITFFREGLPSLTETRMIAARSGTTIRVDTLPGLESAAASVQVSSDSGLPLAVERTQFWGADSYGGHTERAVEGPATRWFFAEGAQGYFDTFVLVANPQATPVDVTLTFLREADTAVTATMQVPPFSRRTIPAATIPEVVGRAFSILVDATQPVVAERAMYFGSTPNRPWTGGAAAAGVTAPSTTWFFAEGATGSFFDTFLLLMNPADDDAAVNVRYLLDSGETIVVPRVVRARERLTINIETESDPRLQSGSMSVLVTSDLPIVAERSVYWPTAEGVQPWGESHVSVGVTAGAQSWALADGRAGGPLNFQTYVLVANLGQQATTLTVQFLPASGPAIVKTYVAQPSSRVTINAGVEAPALAGQSFVTLVTSDSASIVVERSLYWDGGGLTWSGGSNAVATPVP